jgi:hypothetical protein
MFLEIYTDKDMDMDRDTDMDTERAPDTYTNTGLLNVKNTRTFI